MSTNKQNGVIQIENKKDKIVMGDFNADLR